MPPKGVGSTIENWAEGRVGALGGTLGADPFRREYA